MAQCLVGSGLAHTNRSWESGVPSCSSILIPKAAWFPQCPSQLLLSPISAVEVKWKLLYFGV